MSLERGQVVCEAAIEEMHRGQTLNQIRLISSHLSSFEERYEGFSDEQISENGICVDVTDMKWHWDSRGR